MFNGTANNSMSAAWENSSNAIMGKYFLDESTAVRGWLRLGFGSTTDKQYQDDQTSTATPPATVMDEHKASYNAIVLGGGYEMRKGGERLQGYYGGGLNILLAGGKDAYTYGNAIDATYTNPVRTDFNGNDLGGAWLTENKAGSTTGIGLGGFIGVEYFIMPKISVGAEYFWGLMMSSTGDGTATYEYWDGSAVVSESVNTAGASQFGIDTDNNGGAIRLMFHF